MSRFGYVGLVSLLLLGPACRKEVEKVVVQEVDKQYSWAPAGRLFGTQAIVLGMGRDQESVYLHQPNQLGTLTPTATSARYRSLGYYNNAAAYLPADVNIRVPLSANFIATREPGDTLVRLVRPTDPVTSSTYGYIRLRQLDPQALAVSSVDLPGMAFGAINRNDYLLFSYYSKDLQALKFVLSKVSLLAGTRLQAQSRVLSVPVGQSSARVRWIVAIDDYFLANCGNAGLYKIREDGTARRVLGYSVTDACYKWQGVVYLVEEYNSILLSQDDGDTWQRYTGTPSLFDFTTYRVVGDSLVGISRSSLPYLFTLRWQGQRFTTRMLKSDGLGQTAVNGLEQLGDTVYLGTTGGLFKRPLSKFFESK